MALCLHGFQPGQCLICQTLDSTGADGATKRTTRRSDERVKIPGGPVEVVDDRSGAGRTRGATGLLSIVAVIVLALIAFWVAVGVVHAVLRLVEVAIVGIVAGFLGYQVGRARGHRDR